jgi:hypothetical protein
MQLSNSTYRVTIATAQTHCHATVPAALLWKRYQDLTCHNIIATKIDFLYYTFENIT